MTEPLNRCRLVLIAPVCGSAGAETPNALAARFENALSGGDVASVILRQGEVDDKAFQDFCAASVPVIQSSGAAALIAGDSRVAGRVKADGLFIEGGFEALSEAVEKHVPQMIVGGGNARDRHNALTLGECEPDFLFFGKLDGDIKPEPHKKNTDLAEWWAAMVDIPCILMGGSDAGYAVSMAQTGAEFIAFSSAVFGSGIEASSVVAQINRELDEKAPRFDD